MNNEKRRLKNVYTRSFKTAPPPRSIDRSKAFTLAEVLITLGIIGIVAALTLPSLMAKYQKMVYVNQLKKSYSVVTNGFKKMMADDGVDKLSDTQYFSSCQQTTGDTYCPINDTIYKYFNIIEVKDPIFDNQRQAFYAYMADGSAIEFDIFGRGGIEGPYNTYYKACDTQTGWIYIDTNGDKAPNKIGYDRFGFALCDSGYLGTGKNVLDLFASANGSNMGSELDTTLKQEIYNGCPDGKGAILTPELACSSRVIDYDDWQIKY